MGNTRVTSELKEVSFANKRDRDIALATYSSTLFFWYFITLSDCRNVNRREVEGFPLDLTKVNASIGEYLASLSPQLMNNLQQHSEMRRLRYKDYGDLDVQIFSPRLSKPIIDEIDLTLAKHYGFTEEELDFIINYDIKYRMGQENGEDT